MEDEEVLNRVMREARDTKPIAPKIEETGEKKKRAHKEKKSKREGHTSSRRAKKELEDGAAPAAVTKTERRSRSRRRRREKEAARLAPAPGVEAEADVHRRKVLLTPNADFQSGRDAPSGGYPSAGSSKWHFRAEPLPAGAAPVPGARPPQAGAPSPYGAPPGYLGAPPGYPPVAPLMTRPMKTIAPKKWKVVRPSTIVKQTEHLNSAEVRTLHEGEIIEQVSPSVTLPGGIIRILIRHPSTTEFPNPIGWVTLDATSAGGPKFLESGPEPMSRGKPWAPPVGTRAASAQHGGGAAAAWRPQSAPAAPAEAKWGAKGFQNLTWTPS